MKTAIVAALAVAACATGAAAEYQYMGGFYQREMPEFPGMDGMRMRNMESYSDDDWRAPRMFYAAGSGSAEPSPAAEAIFVPNAPSSSSRSGAGSASGSVPPMSNSTADEKSGASGAPIVRLFGTVVAAAAAVALIF